MPGTAVRAKDGAAADLSLSRATPADLPAIADLVNMAYRGERARQSWASEAAYMEGQRTDVESLRRDLQAQPEALLLMARRAGTSELLGCLWLEPAQEDVWYLGMLTVRPDLQAAGLGRTLLHAGEAEARQRGARRMRMTVINIRDTLIAWYERRGYRLTPQTKPFPYEDERFGKPTRSDLFFVILEKDLA